MARHDVRLLMLKWVPWVDNEIVHHLTTASAIAEDALDYHTCHCDKGRQRREVWENCGV